MNKQELMDLVADTLGFAHLVTSRGSTLKSDFIDAVTLALDPRALGESNKYRRLQRSLEAVGETYDPREDSSEHAGPKGGGTITNKGLRKLLRGLLGAPGTFILNEADHPVSAEYADVHGEYYGFNARVSGRMPLLEAGTGSRVVFYRTRKATSKKQHFVAQAVVEGIEQIEPGRWRAKLTQYQELQPVSVEDVSLPDWNRQHGISEIHPDKFDEIVRRGRSEPASLERNVVGPYEEVPLDRPVGGDALAPDLEVPDAPHHALPPLGADTERELAEGEAPSRRSRRERELDRRAELRAVEIVRVYLADRGWSVHKDRQKDGVGYDLDVTNGKDFLKVEVKGIQSTRLAFNMTAKEWVVAMANANYVVITVNKVLTESFYVTILNRGSLSKLQRQVTQIRLRESRLMDGPQ